MQFVLDHLLGLSVKSLFFLSTDSTMVMLGPLGPSMAMLGGDAGSCHGDVGSYYAQ